MSYNQLKWLILFIPTCTIGLWEYARHTYLLPYVSMELGNWLSPVIILAVTVTVVRKLFAKLESLEAELRQERAVKAALDERSQIARELHDGLAQTLFLLAVKAERLEQAGKTSSGELLAAHHDVQRSVQQVNAYVRQAIASLAYPPDETKLPWMEAMKRLTEEAAEETGLPIDFDWRLPEEVLSPKEKVELYAMLREALMNIRKHAQATHVRVYGGQEPAGWRFTVTDDGGGFRGDPFARPDTYGLQTMKRRGDVLGLDVALRRADGRTELCIRKRGDE